MQLKSLALYYNEPNPDRWVLGDHYPRQLIRRLLRGRPSPGGMMRYFLNLVHGLEELGVRFSVNDFRALRDFSKSVFCVIGKPQLLENFHGRKVIFGPAGLSHPIENSHLLEGAVFLKMLVSCQWMKEMFESVYPSTLIDVWAAGIDTRLWCEAPGDNKALDFIVYDKVRWRREEYEPLLVKPILRELDSRGRRYVVVRYGSYKEDAFRGLLQSAKSMIFLCEHETQGFAYLQALSAGVPILAWDRGGYWQDPSFYPHLVKFSPVTSVPYWDGRCGLRFKGMEDFATRLDEFLDRVRHREFSPREYILENFTLKQGAERYLEIYREANEGQVW